MTNHSSSQPQGVRLEVRGVDKRYGARSVLHKADLVIEPGEFVAIVGRSGCGKSTLLRLVAGLESVSGGAIRIDGEGKLIFKMDDISEYLGRDMTAEIFEVNTSTTSPLLSSVRSATGSPLSLAATQWSPTSLWMA